MVPQVPGQIFLSTPSARRATRGTRARVAGIVDFYPRPPRGGRPEARSIQRDHQPISIHALREEGDDRSGRRRGVRCDFYPRPPRGGRLAMSVGFIPARIFLSTPSARRATPQADPLAFVGRISIHALREEGDGSRSSWRGGARYFYPRPPRGGRPAWCLIGSRL